MIFKTFNNDIDKISAKWGIFGKSFYDFEEASRNRKIAIDELFTLNGIPLKDAKKQAGSFWSYLYPSKETIQSQMIDIETLFPKQKDEYFSSLLNGLTQQQNLINTTKGSWTDYFNNLGKGEKWQIEFIKNTDLQKTSLDDVKKAYNSARDAAIAHNAALKQQTIGAKAAALGMKALAVAGNMIAMWAITKAIDFVIKGIDNLAHSAEHCKERVDELISSYKSALDSANSNAKKVEDLVEKYEKLSSGVNNLGKNISLTNEEYEEYNSLVNDIADMFPTLVQGYTDEGNAILSLKGNIEQLRDAYKEAQQEAYNLLISSGKDSDGNDIIANWKNTQNTGFWANLFDLGSDDVGGRISVADALKQLKAIQQMSAEEYREIKRIISSGSRKEIVGLTDIEREIGYGSYLYKALGLGSNSTDEEFREAKRQAKVLIQRYNAEIESALGNVKSLANAYLMTNSTYKNLDNEEVKNAASIIVNSLDANIASQFEDTTDVGEYVNNILELISTNENGIQDALVGLFTTDLSELSAENAKFIVDQYINSIAEVLGEDPVELKVRLKFEDYDTIAENYQKVLHEAAKKASGATDGEIINSRGRYQEYQEVYDKIDEFAQQYSINTQNEIAAFDKALEEANGDIQKAFDLYLTQKEEREKLLITKESIDNAKNYQSELKSLYEALNLLRSGIATPTAINELIQKFPELSKHIDDLEGGIEELVEKKLEELRKAFDGAINEEALKRLAEYSVKQEAIADSIKSTTSALNDMTSAYKNVADAMKQYNDTGYISLELLESIMAMKPEYLGALLDEWNNMNNAADAYKAYVKVRLAEYEAEAWAESNTNRREALAQYYIDGDRTKYDKAVETSIDALAAKLKFVQGIRDNLDKWVNGIGSGSSSSSSSTLDWLEVFLKRIEEKINKVKKVASDTWKSWTDRGKALNSVISETNKELSAQEKAYKTYLDAANKVELSDTLKKRVIEGDPTLPNDKSIDSATRDKINEFKDLYEKAIEAKDKVDDLRQSLQEYASQRISNISKQFDDQISSIEAKKENLDNRITYLNENGISNAIDIYEALIERENEILIENAQKKKALESELTNYNVGTEAWYELKSKINDVSSAIDESRISLVKFENEIRQAKWDGFDRLIDKINLVIEESDFLTEVLSYDDLIDDMGSYTSEGLSTLALHKSNYDVSLAEAKGYTEELKQLRQELADNPANQKLIDRENELQKAQRDTILSAYKEKQTMIDLEKEAIQKQIEAMNKLIDKKKEALNVEKDLYDYQKNLKSKTDNIVNLQKQIAVYSQDNSESGMQKLQSLQKQLSDAQEDLKDTQYDKWVQEQQNMLDELMEEYETVQNEAMNDTDKKFNELCTVIEDNQDRIVEAINNLSNGLVSNNASDNLNDTLMGTSVEDLISYINDSINEITQAETDKLVEKFNDEVSVPFDNIQSIADSNDNGIELTDDIKNVIISDIPEVKDGLTDIDSSIESSSESIVEQLGKVKNVVENCFSVTGTWFSNLSEDLKSLVESNSTATSGKSIAGHSYIMDQLLNGGKLITTGGRPIAGLKGYATGLRKSTSNHLAWTQENGLELIYRKYDGAMLTPISNGDTVFTADMTDNLWNIANSFKPLDVSAIKKQSSNSNSVLSIGQLVLPNVKNYEEFRNELVKDNLFKNEIAKSTANKIVTTNKL